MGRPIFQVDAFTDTPFSGNPAAVCPLDAPAEAAWMQAVAREMNLSETAFTHPEGDGYRLRWFTPLTEVELCGHATLATAHALWEAALAPLGLLRFHTASGVLTATPRDEGWIELDFPADPVTPAEISGPLCQALGITPKWVGRGRFDLLAVTDAATVRALAPDFRRLAALAVRGVIVTAPGDDGECDFVSRFFAPAAGIDEDPVTGSAHCALGPFWGDRLSKRHMVGRQLSARGGVVRVELAGERVRLSGRAVTVLRGELL